MAAVAAFSQGMPRTARRMDAMEAASIRAFAEGVTDNQMPGVLVVSSARLGALSLASVELRSTKPITGKLVVQISTQVRGGESMMLSSWDLGEKPWDVAVPVWTGNPYLYPGPLTIEVVHKDSAGGYGIARVRINSWGDPMELKIQGAPQYVQAPSGEQYVLIQGISALNKEGLVAQLEGATLSVVSTGPAGVMLAIPSGTCFPEGEKQLTVCAKGECTTRVVYVRQTICTGGKG